MTSQDNNSLITNEYILDIIKGFAFPGNLKRENKGLGKIKFGMPLFLRRLVFSAFNPFYVYYIFSAETKWQSQVFKNKYINFSFDFMLYCYTHRISFDLNEYYSKEDQQVALNYLRNRVKSCFNVPLFNQELLNDKASLSEIHRKERETFSKGTLKNLYWNLAGRKIKIPSMPEHSTWYFNLGLDLVPKSSIDNLRGKAFLDIGAFWGDTALKMLELEPGEIWTFEPEENNFQLLSEVISGNNLGGVIKPVKLGAGSKDSTSFISSSGGSSKTDEKGGQKIDLVSIDSFVKEKNLEIGMIKMDIEGNEYEAILGAEHTIKTYRPLLIISLYHNGKDFFEIPPLLKSWNENYNFRFFNAAVADLNEKLLIVY